MLAFLVCFWYESFYLLKPRHNQLKKKKSKVFVEGFMCGSHWLWPFSEHFAFNIKWVINESGPTGMAIFIQKRWKFIVCHQTLENYLKFVFWPAYFFLNYWKKEENPLCIAFMLHLFWPKTFSAENIFLGKLLIFWCLVVTLKMFSTVSFALKLFFANTGGSGKGWC